jgi:hypothetical protein
MVLVGKLACFSPMSAAWICMMQQLVLSPLLVLISFSSFRYLAKSVEENDESKLPPAHTAK